MKYIILFSIIIFSTECEAQNNYSLSCDSMSTIDTTFVKNEIIRISNYNKKHGTNTYNNTLKLSDIDSMLTINIVNIYLDTITNKLTFKVEKEKHILFFFSRNYLYELNNNEQMIAFLERTNNELNFNVTQISYGDFECVCYIPTLFSSNSKGVYHNNKVFYCKLRNSSQEFYINSYGQVFTSFNQFIEYEFGSLENYLETYKKRLRNNDLLKENIKSFYSIPITKRKVRIRGGL